MKRIPNHIKEEIVSLKVQGLTNKKINGKTGISTGKVSEIVNEFAAKLQVNDPQEVFTLCKIMLKNKITHYSAFENIKTGSLLKEMGLSDDDAYDILGSLQSESKNAGLTVSEMINLTAHLGEISKNHDIKGKDLVGLVEEKGKQLEDLKSKIKDADTQRKESESSLDRTLKENSTTMQDIDQYRNLLSGMQDNELDMIDLADMVNMVKQSKKLGYDHEKIVAKIQELESLDDAISKTKRQNEELATSNKILEKSYAEIIEKKEANKSLVDVIDQLNSDGVTHNELRQIHDKIVEIGKDNKISPEKAVKMFYKNIQEQYHTKAGYEYENRTLNDANQELKKQNKEIIEKIKQNKIDYQEQEKAIRFLKQLQKSGMNHHSITEWEETTKKLGMTPAQFQQKIKSLNDLQDMIREKQEVCEVTDQKVAELKSKKNELATQVKTLEGKRSELVNMKEIMEKAINLSMKTCQKTIQEFGTYKLKGEVDSMIQKIHSAFDDVYDMEERHAKVREDIAKAEFLRPLYNITVSDSNNLDQVWFPLHSLLVRLEANISKQNTADNFLLRNVTNLRESVHRLLLSCTQA